jgi:hypothetical protein
MKLRYWQPLSPGIAAKHLRATVGDLEWLERSSGSLLAALA